MLLELEHEFGHSRRLNNVPYVPGDDLPVLSDESILKVVCCTFGSRCLANLHTDIPKNTDMDMTTIAYSMKISNF
jgi:hypothetical protein